MVLRFGISSQSIVPLARVFRRAGALVVHAPSPRVARKYPKYLSNLKEEEPGGTARAEPIWPPEDFKNRMGPYAPWADPTEPATAEFDALIENWQINKLITTRRA